MRHNIRSDTARLTMKTFLAVRIALFLITTKITRRFPDAPKRIIKAYNVIKDPKVQGATLALYFQSFTTYIKNDPRHTSIQAGSQGYLLERFNFDVGFRITRLKKKCTGSERIHLRNLVVSFGRLNLENFRHTAAHDVNVCFPRLHAFDMKSLISLLRPDFCF